MAEYCLCCGKKLGVFTGNHLDNTVCDNCYFKFAGTLETIKDLATLEEIDAKYKDIIGVVNQSGFTEDGRKHIIAYVDRVKQEKCDQILNKEKAVAISLQEQKRRAEIKKQYEVLRKEMLLTTSNSFEGYDIVEYCGIKSGSVVLGTGFLSEISASLNDIRGTEDNRMAKKIEEAKEAAQDALINKCVYMGANGIVGIEFDIMTLGANMIVVSVNGTAVKIAKK